MQIRHDLLEGSPALAPFMRNYAELIESGWARPFTAHNGKHRVVYAVDDTADEVVMGGIVYALNSETRTGWIVLSFTEKAYRQQGVYTALHSALERRLLEAGMDSIASHVHVNNAPRLASCESVGLVPEFYRMNKPLKG